MARFYTYSDHADRNGRASHWHWHWEWRSWRQSLNILVFVFILLVRARAQQPDAPAPAKPIASLPTIQNLKVVVLAGAGEMNDLERRTTALLVVQVLDANDRPVEGADVVFRFPLQGAGATFANGRTSQTFRSDAQGQAAALNWTANSQVGTFQIHVTASYGNQIGETTLSMTNVTRITDAMKKKQEKRTHWWTSKRFMIGAIVVTAAVVTGVILATRDSGSGSTANGGTTVTISPGSPTFGGP